MTSSKMSRAPWASQSSRSPVRNPGFGGTTPMLPATGSTTTHATSCPDARMASAADSRSL